MPSNFRNGVLSRGMPTESILSKGDVYHVDSGHANADDGNEGKNPNQPLATLDAAIGKCTANNGDIILASEGHAENITLIDSIDVDVAGVTIIGLGSGNDMPTFSATAAAGSLQVNAASVTLINLKFVANFAGGVTFAINLLAAADYCTMEGLIFRDTTTDKEYLKHLQIADTVTDLVVRRCSFVGLAGTMTNSIFFVGVVTDGLIEDCYFFVDSSDDVIDALTSAAVNLVVRHCVVINADTGAAGYCLRHHANGTGVAYRNIFAYNKDDADISAGAAAWWIENYASNTIAESGRLDPTTSHAIP